VARWLDGQFELYLNGWLADEKQLPRRARLVSRASVFGHSHSARRRVRDGLRSGKPGR